MKDYKLNLNSKVILKFENKKIDFPNEENIEGYLDRMEHDIEEKHTLYPGFGMNSYDELGEVKVIANAIISGLTYHFEYDDLFYSIKDNTIYIDRLDTKDKVR